MFMIKFNLQETATSGYTEGLTSLYPPGLVKGIEELQQCQSTAPAL